MEEKSETKVVNASFVHAYFNIRGIQYIEADVGKEYKILMVG